MNSSLILNKEVNSGTINERLSVLHNGDGKFKILVAAAEEKRSKRDLMPESDNQVTKKPKCEKRVTLRCVNESCDRDDMEFMAIVSEAARVYTSKKAATLKKVHIHIDIEKYSSDLELQGLKEYFGVAKAIIKCFDWRSANDRDFVVNILESVIILMYQLTTSKSHTSRLVAFLAFYKQFSSKAILSSSNFESVKTIFLSILPSGNGDSWTREEVNQYDDLFPTQEDPIFREKHFHGEETKSDEYRNSPYKTTAEIKKSLERLRKNRSAISGAKLQSFEENIANVEDYLTRYSDLRSIPIFDKLYKLAMYGLSLRLFDRIGITMDKLQFDKLSQACIRNKYHMGPDFIHCMISTMTFICKQGYQWVKGGFNSIDFYYSGSQYEKWYDDTGRVKFMKENLNNPALHGFTRPEFLALLSSTISRGELILKHANGAKLRERFLVRSTLDATKLIQADVKNKVEARKLRRAPIAWMVYGGSGVCKTTFARCLFNQYGRTFGLPIKEEMMYTRNSDDDFWSGFNSYMWCVLLDDVAKAHVKISSAGDKSCAEFIQVINNAPFTPNMADLEDKGKQPMLARLVIGTTNVEHLNAVYYYSNSLAAQRRFSFLVELDPKPEYAKDVVMLNAGLLPPLEEGCYPNYWNITVKRAVPRSTEKDSQQADLVVVKEFTEINDFLAFYSAQCMEHEVVQDKVDVCSAQISQIVLCEGCYRPSNDCNCVTDLQAGFTNLKDICLPCQEYYTLCRCPSCPICQVKPCSCSKNSFKVEHCRANLGLNDEQAYLYTLGHSILTYKENSTAKSWWRGYRAYLADMTSEWFISLYFDWKIFFEGTNWLYQWPFTRMIFDRWLFCSLNDSTVYRRSMARMGVKAERSFGNVSVLTSIIAVLAGSAVIYKVLSLLITSFYKTDVKDTDLQAERYPKSDCTSKTTVWKNEADYCVTSHDLSPLSKSWKALSIGDVIKHVKPNIANFSMVGKTPLGTLRNETNAFALYGDVFICNTHSIPDSDSVDITITCMETVGPSLNKVVRVSREEFFNLGDDVSAVRIRGLPPFRDLRALVACDTLNGVFNGHLLTRERSGKVKVRSARCVKYCSALLTKAGEIKAWKQIVDIPTASGDCGSVLLCMTAYGPVINGIHITGAAECAVSIAITQSLVSCVEAAVGDVIMAGTPNLHDENFDIPVAELQSNAAVRWVQHGEVGVMGSFRGTTMRFKSRVKKTPICDRLVKDGVEVKFHRPYQPLKAYAIGIRELVAPKALCNKQTLNMALEGYIRDVVEGLGIAYIKENIHTVPLDVAINGFQSTRFVDRINCGTSAGFPYNRSKKYHVTTSSDPTLCCPLGGELELDKIVLSRYNMCIEKYDRGERYCPVFRACPKDEAISAAKAAIGKQRIFLGCPLEWGLVVRKIFIMFVKVMQENHEVFECAPGLNAHSIEWQQLYSFLVQFNKNNMVAGDFKGFDKSMAIEFLNAAYDFLYEICRLAGFSDKELRYINCIRTDTIFAFCEYHGDLLEFLGSNPSGQPLTVIINCIVNALYMRYAYTETSPSHHCRDFKKFVALMTYGDDNVMGVSDATPWFNHTTIASVLSTIGVTYTMADKTSASVPYIPIESVSFLKRTWRYDADVKVMLAPLEHDSIEKMLTVCVESKSICIEDQIVSTVESAVREYFFYGKDIFVSKRKYLQEVVADCGLYLFVKPSTFPDWDKLYKEFWENSTKKVVRLDMQ